MTSLYESRTQIQKGPDPMPTDRRIMTKEELGDFDPIAAMDARHAVLKEEELARAQEQNRESARRTEVARQERDPELVMVDLANRWQADLARMPSPEAQALMEKHNGQSPAIAKLQAEQDEWSAAEILELAEATGVTDDLKALLGKKK